MIESRFESQEDREREKDTLSILCGERGLRFELLNELNPVDVALYDKDDKVVAYAEVKTYQQCFAKAKPHIFISIRKLVSLQKVSRDNEVPSCMVYRFEDCIGYYFISEIEGATCGWDGREAREGSVYDRELVVHIPKTLLKTIK